MTRQRCRCRICFQSHQFDLGILFNSGDQTHWKVWCRFTLLSHDYRLTPLVLFDHCPWNYPIFIRLETIPFDADRHPGHDTDAIYHSYLEKAILSQGSLTLVPVVGALKLIHRLRISLMTCQSSTIDVGTTLGCNIDLHVNSMNCNSC